MFFYCSNCWRAVSEQHRAHHVAHSNCTKLGEIVFLRQPPNNWEPTGIDTVWFAPESLQVIQTRYGNPLLDEEKTIIETRMRRLAANILDKKVLKSLSHYRSRRENELSADGNKNFDPAHQRQIISQIDRAEVLGNELSKAIDNSKIKCLACFDNVRNNFHLYVSLTYTSCTNGNFHAYCGECFNTLINTPADPRNGDYRSRFTSDECTLCFNRTGFYQRIAGGDDNNENK